MSEAINSAPKLENKAVKFTIRALPKPEPTADEKEITIALARYAVEHNSELKNSGHQFDVLIRSACSSEDEKTEKSELENFASMVGRVAIDDIPSLKKSGLQIDVRIRQTLHQMSDEESLAVGMALSKREA